MTLVIPQLLTPRFVSMRLRLPWNAAREALEGAGCRVLRVAGRERVRADDLAKLLDAGRQPTAAEMAARVDDVIAQVSEEMGVTRRTRKARR